MQAEKVEIESTFSSAQRDFVQVSRSANCCDVNCWV